ncbi:hypothetical protein AALP_AA8G197500 [Arabis alpina]|uniref:Uncharacterized protein n=1 Tax=Arabis alpina TaxID=50452 RepID=A0A087G855_ARAAL|nr:hypothetical protein AALP_AA8G197500 [Arabis alpina]
MNWDPIKTLITTSFTQADKFFIDPDRLLSLARFLPQPKGQAQSGGRGGMSGSIRSGR